METTGQKKKKEKKGISFIPKPLQKPFCMYTKQTTGIYIKTECSGIDLYYVEITVQK